MMSGTAALVLAANDVVRARVIHGAVFLIWLVLLLNTPFEYYGSLPRGLFSEVGVLVALRSVAPISDWLLSPGVLALAKTAAIAGCALAIVWRDCPRGLLLPTAILILILDSLTKSLQAYANHAQIVPLLVLFVVACVGTRRAGSDARLVNWLSALAIAIPYTFIGLNRIIEGGLALFASDTILNYMALASHYHSASGFMITPQLMALPAFGPMVRLSFVAVTAAEVSSVAAIVFPAWRRVWIASMTVFHVTSWFLMNIFFWENLVLIWAVYGPLPGHRTPRDRRL